MRALSLVVDEITRLAQRRASDPRASAWVSANAGAGKTKVLTDRVVRLMLHGVAPARILCLTFTKAAAANMAIRVFERLGRWVTLDDAALSAELTELEGAAPAAPLLGRARKLFAHAVETPGGLKIETLHALCERLLHLVPFEANVPAGFTVLDEAEVAEAIGRALDTVLADAAGEPALAAALRVVGAEAAGETLRAALADAVAERAVGPDSGGLAALDADLCRTLGLAPSDVPEAIERAMREDGLAEWAALAARLRIGAKTDEERADAFVQAAGALAADPAAALAAYRTVFFTKDGEGEPRSDKLLVTKAVPADLKADLLAERDRLALLDDRLRAARARERTLALFTLALEVRARVERRKARAGALDFDDLIHKTVDLLTRVDSAWILYRLDRGVDHVLVDEAQDTNPEQWAILARITAEFSAGAGARGALRTRFAVGDPKQSIYSFQGAEPERFEITRREWLTASRAAELGFEDVGLTLSFRSTHGVLSAVDATFADPAHFRGLSFADVAVGTVHRTARPGALGHVEIWATQQAEPTPDPDAWVQPVDQPDAGSPALVTARRVARAVRAWTTRGDETGRVWRPGEVLVLVRKRGPAFEGVIRALKAEGVPVAGQDRLDIAAHIAVIDLVAAGRAALLPEDDLTLAGALKSPLVGLDDEDLVRLAASRGEDEPLAAALARHAQAGDPAAQRGAAALALWSRLAHAYGPFGFYAHLIGPHGGRAALVGRLGGEAGDAIDVFLATARQAEQGGETASLTAFLARYEFRGGRGTGGHTVKRDLEAGRDEVRVMTVHGAKGLEAPLVVVIDGCEVLGRDPALVPVEVAVPGGSRRVPVWAPSKPADGSALAAARARLQALGREEHNRLLYVAMTRAADRLVIASYRGGGRGPMPEAAWCEMVRRGLAARAGLLVEVETADGPVQHWRDGAYMPAPQGPATVVAPAEHPPAWLFAPPVREAAPAPPLRPSAAFVAADAIVPRGRREGRAQARLRGTLVHTLLEHLPGVAPGRRAQAAAAFLAARAPSLSTDAREAIAADVHALIATPGLAPLFAAEARAEVALAGRVLAGGVPRAVEGRVDRLAVTPDAVLLAEFKTGAPPAAGEDPPAGHVVQTALYAGVLAALYPDRPVRALLVYTAGPVVRALSPADLAAALAAMAGSE